MAITQDKATEKATRQDRNDTPTDKTDPRVSKIDRTAPAGTKNSLGAESVRDGRPSTDDSTVEAIDEEGPDITVP
jgi:hypothetical protein